MIPLKEINKRKLLAGGAVIALALAVGVFTQRYPAISDFLSTSPERSSATARAALLAKIASTKQASRTGVATVEGKININTANAERLMMLKGIGGAKADAIVSYRNSNGPFYRPEDIMKVSGIGKAMYENIRDHITVGNIAVVPQNVTATSPSVQNDEATATSSPALLTESPVHLLIYAVMAGEKGNAAYEFIELYNPTVDPINLSGWTVKKRSSRGSVSALVSSSRLKGKIIPPSKYFLLANQGYTGAPSADILWASSYTLAQTNNSVILYDKSGQTSDSVSWSSLPEGKSYSRSSPESSDFTITDPVPHNSSI